VIWVCFYLHVIISSSNTTLGIKTNILELDWSSTSAHSQAEANANPVEMPSAFETHARKLRFQALGKACLQNDIKTLLLGHHRDDTVETTISRLCSGARGAALAGISEVARIPECHGLWGISEGGSYVKLLGTQRSDADPIRVRIDSKNSGKIEFHPSPQPLDARTFLPRWPTFKDQDPSSLPPWVSLQPPLASSSLLTATGGIWLCRPLLSFPKSRLVETCKHNKVPYVSDPTNFDPTLTIRNTIRHLLSKKALPRALQPASILSLIKAEQAALQKTQDISNEILASRCHILDLNLRTGTLIVEFNNTLSSTETALGVKSRRLLSTIMRRVTDLIAPCPANHYNLRHYDPCVSKIFPDRYTVSQAKHLRDREPFTAGGVLFSPLTPQFKLDPKDPTTPKSSHSVPGKNIWRLSRPLYMKNRKPKMQFEQGTWALWDDRYWFRFTMAPDLELNGRAYSSLKPPSLVVRPFETTDRLRIRDEEGMLAGEEYGRVAPSAEFVSRCAQSLFALEAPGSVRHTIPVLTLKEMSPSGHSETPEQLLLLPTFGLCLSGMKRGPAFDEMNFYWKGVWWKMSWNWRYKMIDTEAVRLMGGPGVTDKPTGYGTDV